MRELRVEGAGYLNVFLDRPALAARLLSEPLLAGGGGLPDGAGKRIVEHTNINPNKAAHIGHLRNAVLGDTLVRCLRALGVPVEVQNYIDDTGVQVADVVVGFVDLERRTVAEVAAIPEPFDFHCWDLYSRGRRLVRGGRRAAGAPARDAPRAREGAGRARRDGAAGGAARSSPATWRPWRAWASATTC